MNYTENYQLNQWAKSDRVLMEDFNRDNEKIDAALGEKCGVVFGTYTGDGAAERIIKIGFTPKLLYLCNCRGCAGSLVGSGYCSGGLAAPGHPVKHTDTIAAEIVENGFRVTHPNDYIRTNLSGDEYYYIAFR